MEDRLSALESSFQEFRSVLDSIQKKLEDNSNSSVPSINTVTPSQPSINTRPIPVTLSQPEDNTA